MWELYYSSHEHQKTLYDKQMQQEIIIQMSHKINKGNNLRTMQLEMFCNLVLESFTGDQSRFSWTKVEGPRWNVGQKKEEKEENGETNTSSSIKFMQRETLTRKGAVLENQDKN